MSEEDAGSAEGETPKGAREAELERWNEIMSAPATRSELLQLIAMVHGVFLAHSAFEAAVVGGDPDAMRKLGLEAIDRSGAILSTLRDFISRWEKDHG